MATTYRIAAASLSLNNLTLMILRHVRNSHRLQLAALDKSKIKTVKFKEIRQYTEAVEKLLLSLEPGVGWERIESKDKKERTIMARRQVYREKGEIEERLGKMEEGLERLKEMLGVKGEEMMPGRLQDFSVPGVTVVERRTLAKGEETMEVMRETKEEEEVKKVTE